MAVHGRDKYLLALAAHVAHSVVAGDGISMRVPSPELVEAVKAALAAEKPTGEVCG